MSFFWRKASAVERWKDCLPQAAFSHWDSDRIDSLCVNLFGAGYAIAWYDPFWWTQQRQPQDAARPCDDMVVELTVQAGDFGKRRA